jgi:DNA mismatch repair ATPase MutL
MKYLREGGREEVKEGREVRSKETSEMQRQQEKEKEQEQQEQQQEQEQEEQEQEQQEEEKEEKEHEEDEEEEGKGGGTYAAIFPSVSSANAPACSMLSIAGFLLSAPDHLPLSETVRCSMKYLREGGREEVKEGREGRSKETSEMQRQQEKEKEQEQQEQQQEQEQEEQEQEQQQSAALVFQRQHLSFVCLSWRSRSGGARATRAVEGSAPF